MGQYHKTVNLDKREFINPHKLGDGLKLLEQCGWSPGGTNDALHLLLACSSGRGGGDFQSDSPLIGSWAGDRIAVIGDYAEPDDIPGFNAAEIYSLCHDPEDGEGPERRYRDITDDLIPVLEREYECVYVGDGWCDRFDLSDIKGYSSSHGYGDRMICFSDETQTKRIEIPFSQLRDALKRFLAAVSGRFHWHLPNAAVREG